MAKRIITVLRQSALVGLASERLDPSRRPARLVPVVLPLLPRPPQAVVLGAAPLGP